MTTPRAAGASARAGAGMIAIVAPEPAPWLSEAITAAAAASVRVRLFAPWAMPARAGRLLARLPGPARGFARRRVLAAAAHVPDGNIAVDHAWRFTAVELAARAWARDRADRILRARFALRRLVDAAAARWLTRLRPAPLAVLAPSCAAELTFAAAGLRGVATVLIEDLPAIRELHEDLDAAARVHPDCAFLRRFRAPPAVIARQEAERVLSGWLAVRGSHARERRLAGHDPDRVVTLGARPVSNDAATPRPLRERTAPARALLAGLAAARHGTPEALAALADRPGLELVIRPGEGMEPAGLLDHPRIRAATRDEIERLDGIDLVLAPAWCETHLPEIAAARAAGVPIVATARAAGFTLPDREVPPGDAVALGRAVDHVLAHVLAGPAPPAAPVLPDLAAAVAAAVGDVGDVGDVAR